MIMAAPLQHRFKIERNDNVSISEDLDVHVDYSRKKSARDPMSHRIIEKRRRDRMNSCLADLSRLIPSVYLKKGRRRIEKTEIIEMAITHLKQLQEHAYPQKDSCVMDVRKDTVQYRLGYEECLSETVNFLINVGGFYAEDVLCLRLIEHLKRNCETTSSGRNSFNNSSVPNGGHSSNSCNSSSLSSDETADTSSMIICNQDNFHFPKHVGIYNDSSWSSSKSVPCEMNSDISQCSSSSTLETINNIELAYLSRKDFKSEFKNNSPCDSSFVSATLLPVDDGQSGTSFQDARSIVSDSCPSSTRGDEIYKFKRKIKDRFNADLKSYKPSKTDSRPMWEASVVLPSKLSAHPINT